MRDWLQAMLSAPAREYAEFRAALSFLPAALDDEIAEVGRFLPRLFAIESEYQRQIVDTELAYVRGPIEDLWAERITWSYSGRG